MIPPFSSLEFGIAVAMFAVVTVLGFVAARWNRPTSLASVEEWGLGGRRFGTVVTWFLIGGDLYTAYTFVAVPALLFGTGAAGFFAVPYTIAVFPLVMLPAARMWSVCHEHGYATAADFVRGRHGSRLLALLVAITGIVATVPYIALQLTGIKAIIEVMGIGGDWPLWIAFIALAAYTWTSGLRAPALIAFVKDILIYIMVLVAVIYIPYKLGGYDIIFHRAQAALSTKKLSTLLAGSQYLGYATLALGSALALFLYPHAVTGVLATRSRNVVKKNMSLLPAYSLMLGFIALLGYMALAAHVKPVGGTAKAPDSTTIVPVLFNSEFPHWFAAIAFGAIAIGALVPAAIMGISAANTFARDIYRPYLRPGASDREEGLVSQIVSVILKLGAVGVIVGLKLSFAIEFQLIGGVIVIEILPALVLGLYTRWYHRWALAIGWVAGMGLSIYMLYVTPGKTTAHFGSASFAFSTWGFHTKVTIWTGIVGVLTNLIVATVLTPLLARLPRGRDETSPADYEEAEAPPMPLTRGQAAGAD
ncbi:MAG TPA: sodium:solute symporter [Streptosporangiaceae bacterium]|nr:sodium:solute symporter [Streptosporangiaceae bacterium]